MRRRPRGERRLARKAARAGGGWPRAAILRAYHTDNRSREQLLAVYRTRSGRRGRTSERPRARAHNAGA